MGHLIRLGDPMGGVERGFSALGSGVVARLEANDKLYHQDAMHGVQDFSLLLSLAAEQLAW